MEHFLEQGIHWQVINFVIFVVILLLLLRRPVREFFSKRSTELKFQIDEAHRLRTAAQAKHREYEERLKRMADETRRLRNDLMQEGEAERRAVLKEGEQTIAQLKIDAQRIAQQELQRAKQALREEAASLTVSLAERLIRDQITPEDQARMTQEAVAALKKTDSTLGGAR